MYHMIAWGARIWLVVVASALGIGCQSSTVGDKAESTSTTTLFTEITDNAGLGEFSHETGAFGEKRLPETVGGGGGFIDFDGDGSPDILLIGGGVWSQESNEEVRALRLYRNEGDGMFTEVTEEAGLGDVRAYGMGVTVADYDNDRDDDFFFTTLERDMLFRNDGSRFTEVTGEAGVAGPSAWSTAAVFFDGNRDGHLDLFVGGYVKWPPRANMNCTVDGTEKVYCSPEGYEGIRSHYYLNNGDGSFVEATEEVGMAGGPGKTLGAAMFDYNDDGWIDLYVANDTERNLLYENDGTGKFVEKGVRKGVAYNDHGMPRAGMGVAVGDIENSGYQSVFVGNFTDQMIGVFQYDDRGRFIDRAIASRTGHRTLMTLTFGLMLLDVDLDGYLDLFAANGHIQKLIHKIREGVSYRQPVQLFHNNRDGTFTEIEPENDDVLSRPMVARGAAYADVDKDGDLDVLITESDGPAHLLQNNTRPSADSSGNYLRVTLEGRESNREGIGARIVVVASGERMEREMRTGSTYLSSSERVVTFGLGQATVVDSLIVQWPSGRREVFEEVEGNQRLEIIEGEGTTRELAATHGEPARARRIR
jgi:hypothetical protein